MAIYASSQPLWKRSTAAILDFFLAATVFGLLLYQFFPGNDAQVKASNPGVNQAFALGPWASLTLLALIIAYFVVLGRTGGTVFQRLFGMNELAVRVSGRLERGRSPDLPQPEQYELVL